MSPYSVTKPHCVEDLSVFEEITCSLIKYKLKIKQNFDFTKILEMYLTLQ